MRKNSNVNKRGQIHSCEGCLWQDQCSQTLSEKDKKDVKMYGCDYSDSLYLYEIDDGDTDYIDRLIDRGRMEYRREYIDGFDEFQAEWN